MDDSASHPLDKPIDWERSMLAMHDTVYCQADKCPVERNTPEDLTNVNFMNPDHQPKLVFEQWPEGKPPPSTTELSRNADFPCSVPDCDKAFGRKGDLQRHLKSHQSGPRSYNCVADGCPRRGMKGFWRRDKLKDHLDRKHPEIEVERWYLLPGIKMGGYRDVAKRGEHEALMRSKGFELYSEEHPLYFRLRD
ncbi:MAG: hypothetical protein Q9178_005691 [Gyalolechia marmorata]